MNSLCNLKCKKKSTCSLSRFTSKYDQCYEIIPEDLLDSARRNSVVRVTRVGRVRRLDRLERVARLGRLVREATVASQSGQCG